MIKAHPGIFFLVYAFLLSACSGGAGGASLPFAENFDDAETCFNRDTESFAALEIENGEFIIEVNADDQLVWSTCDGLILDDFTFEMEVYDDTGGEGFRFIGLQFRKGPVDGSSNQYYLVRFGLGGGDSSVSCAALASDTSWIDDLTRSPSGDSCWMELSRPIQPGEWTRVEITANGPEITYKVNGAPVASVNDTRLTRGVIALFAGTHNEDNARFKIDNLRITVPAE